jgi:hypothetical protein
VPHEDPADAHEDERASGSPTTVPQKGVLIATAFTLVVLLAYSIWATASRSSGSPTAATVTSIVTVTQTPYINNPLDPALKASGVDQP